LFGLPEDGWGNSELEHGDLSSCEAVQGALERADEGALDLLHLGGAGKVSEVLGSV